MSSEIASIVLPGGAGAPNILGRPSAPSSGNSGNPQGEAANVSAGRGEQKASDKGIALTGKCGKDGGSSGAAGRSTKARSGKGGSQDTAGDAGKKDDTDFKDVLAALQNAASTATEQPSAQTLVTADVLPDGSGQAAGSQATDNGQFVDGTGIVPLSVAAGTNLNLPVPQQSAGADGATLLAAAALQAPGDTAETDATQASPQATQVTDPSATAQVADASMAAAVTQVVVDGQAVTIRRLDPTATAETDSSATAASAAAAASTSNASAATPADNPSGMNAVLAAVSQSLTAGDSRKKRVAAPNSQDGPTPVAAGAKALSNAHAADQPQAGNDAGTPNPLNPVGQGLVSTSSFTAPAALKGVLSARVGAAGKGDADKSIAAPQDPLTKDADPLATLAAGQNSAALQQPVDAAKSASAPAAQVGATGGLSGQITGSYLASGAPVGQQVVIRLTPPELGEVRMIMQTQGSGEVQCRLEVSNPHTLDQIQREAPDLIHRLADSGVQIKGLDLTLRESGSSAPSYSTAHDGQGAQQNNQWQWQQGTWQSLVPDEPSGTEEVAVAAAGGQSSSPGSQTTSHTLNAWI